jgi:hypothetical protein
MHSCANQLDCKKFLATYNCHSTQNTTLQRGAGTLSVNKMEFIYGSDITCNFFTIEKAFLKPCSGKGRGIIYVLVLSYIKGIVSRDESCFEGL